MIARAEVDPAILSAWQARQYIQATKVYSPSEVKIKIGGAEVRSVSDITIFPNPPGLCRELLRGATWTTNALARRMGVKASTVRGMITRLRQKGVSVRRFKDGPGPAVFTIPLQ